MSIGEGPGRASGEHRLATVSDRRRKHWGWGYEDQQPSVTELQAMAAGLADRLGIALGEPEAPVALEQLELAPARVVAPASLAQISSSDDHARASHSLGKSYAD